MCSSLRALLALLVIAHPSLSEDPVFEGRWITRPPVDTEYPYAVYIKMSQADDETCSGSFIDPSFTWVLTAARCMYKNHEVVENETSLTVYAGVDKNLTDGQKLTSKNMTIHEIYGKEKYFSIALVNVEWPLNTSKNKKVSYLNLKKVVGFPKDKVLCTSGSYGRLDWDKPVEFELKKMANMVQTCSCLPSLQEAFPNVSTEQLVCGESLDNIGICKGDFGAALRSRDSQGDKEIAIAIAINIVSFVDLKTCEIKDKVSKECGKMTSVSVYTEVCHHLDWIHSVVKEVPGNSAPCDAPDSAVSVHINKSRNGILFFAMFYLIMVSCVS